MKTIFNIAITALLLLTGISTFAQQKVQRKTPEERAAIMTSRMKTSLTLSDDQYVRVKAVNLTFTTKFDEIRAAEDKKGFIGKMKNLDSERMRELKAVLTPDQYTKYETEKKAAKEKMRRSMEERMKQRS